MSCVLNDANSRKKQRRMKLHLIIFRPLNVMNIGLAGGEEEEEGDVIVQSTFTLEIRS